MLDFEGNDIPGNCIINSEQVSLRLDPNTGFHNKSPLYLNVLHSYEQNKFVTLSFGRVTQQQIKLDRVTL